MNPLHKLRRFYQTGRTEKGGYMGENEDVDNATYRCLSTFSDDEILLLIQGAEKFISMAQTTLEERIWELHERS